MDAEPNNSGRIPGIRRNSYIYVDHLGFEFFQNRSNINTRYVPSFIGIINYIQNLITFF